MRVEILRKMMWKTGRMQKKIKTVPRRESLFPRRLKRRGMLESKGYAAVDTQSCKRHICL